MVSSSCKRAVNGSWWLQHRGNWAYNRLYIRLCPTFMKREKSGSETTRWKVRNTPPCIIFICISEIELLESWGQSESLLNQNRLRDPPSPIIWSYLKWVRLMLSVFRQLFLRWCGVSYFFSALLRCWQSPNLPLLLRSFSDHQMDCKNWLEIVKNGKEGHAQVFREGKVNWNRIEKNGLNREGNRKNGERGNGRKSTSFLMFFRDRRARARICQYIPRG